MIQKEQMIPVSKTAKRKTLVEDCKTASSQKIQIENTTWIEGLRIVIAVLIQTPTTKAHHADIPSIEG
jgi:hypothetical protein